MWLTPGRYRGSYITEIQFSVLLKSYLTILLFLKYSSLSCLIRNRYTRASFTSDNNFTFSNLHLKIVLCKENYLQCRYNLYIYTGFVNVFVRPGLLFDVSAAIFWRVNAETLQARARTMKQGQRGSLVALCQCTCARD